MEKCTNCGEEKEDVKERVVKENGVLGYYDVKRKYCDACTDSHNHYLLADWG